MKNKKNNWKSNLTDEQYKVLIEKGTEQAFSGKYLNNKEEGNYMCVLCGSELFSSKTKFDSKTGWPSFTNPANKKNIKLLDDNTLGMKRIEVVCKKCGGHLGHVFDDGPNGKKRYCINSCSLDFKKGKKDKIL